MDLEQQLSKAASEAIVGTMAPYTGSIVGTEADNVRPEASEEFVYTPYVQEIIERATAYLEVGYPIHLAGPAGTGKTTIAFHIAAQREQAVTLIHGNDEASASDLVGKNSGYHKRKVVDNFIHTVLKTEEEMKMNWSDNRLTTACLNGDTLIYDEFNRSRPEANNIFLSVLGESILNLPERRHTAGDGYLDVNPEFRAIFTSNPEEYAGTHKTQDALMDRLITIHVDHYDRNTEIQITIAKSGVARSDAEKIVDIVRELRHIGKNKHRPTIRACIAIAKIVAHQKIGVKTTDSFFQRICRDILSTDIAKVVHDGHSNIVAEINGAIQKVCGTPMKPRKSKRA